MTTEYTARYEMKIQVLDPAYVDSLIVALVRQGYGVYYNEDENVVCYTISDDELTEIKYTKEEI